MPNGIPLPPLELMQRVGRVERGDVVEAYLAIGRHCRDRLERLLPDDWSWEGKRVLDFGCGAGRTLRHFLDLAERAELHGCDIDEASIDWLTAHLVPPLHVFRTSEEPSLPRADGAFDLVYAFSVFTHIADGWSQWLLELRRVLAPDGFLIATFLNEPYWSIYGRGRWEDQRVGMTVIKKWNPWDDGGPIVLHSEWWLREHWGRAFDILYVEPTDPEESDGIPVGGQGAVLLRPKAVEFTPAELEQPADDPRELAAVQTNLEQLHAEAAELYERARDATVHRYALARLESEVERLHAELDAIGRSHSWRLTQPLRAVGTTLRKAKR